MMEEQTHLTDLALTPTLEWHQAFGAWLFTNEKSINTINAYLQDVRHFAMFFLQENGQAFDPSFLNATDIKKYFSQLDTDKSVAPRTRNRRLASLRVLVRYAVEIGALEYDPTVSVKREKVKAIPRDRTAAEMQSLNTILENGGHVRCTTELHAWLARRDRMIFILCKDAGFRESEVCSVDVDDVDFEDGIIHVMGKGGKKDYVNVSTKTLEEIASWLTLRPAGTSQALITDQAGNRITRSTVWRRIKMIGQAANVNNLRPHDLRHTFAYAVAQSLLDQGLPQLAAMNGVQNQLRHGDTKTSALYFGIRDSQIRAAMEAIQ